MLRHPMTPPKLTLPPAPPVGARHDPGEPVAAGALRMPGRAWWPAMRRMEPWLASLAVGAVAGLACLLSVAGVVWAGLSVAVLAWATRERRRELFRPSLWALAVRWLLILGVTFGMTLLGRFYMEVSLTPIGISGDDAYYTVKAWWLRQFILGHPLAPEEWLAIVQNYQPINYGKSGHLFPMALFYDVFGYQPTAVRGISALLGVLLGLVIYDLARPLTGRGAARWACLAVWWWPSLIVWSLTNDRKSTRLNSSH